MKDETRAKIEPKHIDQVAEEMGDFLADIRSRSWSHIEVAMGLALLVAHELIHDGANEEDFVKVARAAWRKSREVHGSRMERGGVT